MDAKMPCGSASTPVLPISEPSPRPILLKLPKQGERVCALEDAWELQLCRQH